MDRQWRLPQTPFPLRTPCECYRAGSGAYKALRNERGQSMVSDVDLLAFIRRSIPSVWALDVLMLVRQPPRRSWSSDELVGELRASGSVVRGALTVLKREGLITQGDDGRIQFSPASALLEEITVALAEAYAERPVSVIKAIVSTEVSLQALADAFRLDPPKS